MQLHLLCSIEIINVFTCALTGLRAIMKKDADAFKKLVEAESVDVLCLQETKVQDKHASDWKADHLMDGWVAKFSCSTAKAGYSGTAILYKKASFPDDAKPKLTVGMGKDNHDTEGRIMTMELSDMYIVNVYVPNSGVLPEKLRSTCCRLLWQGGSTAWRVQIPVVLNVTLVA
jgi:exodeoxyribonuclease III